jgi:hypothetical protein
MAKIPLNKFRNRLIEVETSVTGFFYEVPPNRATIIINAQASNSEPVENYISLYISEGEGGALIPLVKNFPVPGYDSRSLIAGRYVLEGVDGTTDPTTAQPDRLYVEALSPGMFLHVSLLETVNKT